MNIKLFKIKSIRTALIGMVIATVVILEAINITFGASNLKTGIEYETMQGLNAACLSYAQVLNITEHNDSIDNSTLEADLNNSTGYEYTYFLGNIRERSSIDGVVGTEANEDIYNTVVNNLETYTNDATVIGDSEYYVVYQPLIYNGECYGMAFVGLQKDTITTYITSMMTKMVGTGLVAMFIILTIAILAAIRLSNAIKRNVEAIDKLATGELNIEIDEKITSRKDELGQTAKSILSLADKLHNVIGSAKHSSEELDTSAEELSESADTMSVTAENVSSAVDQIACGATEQAESLQDAVSSVEEINGAIELITQNTEHMNTIAENMQKNSTTSSASLQELQASTEETIQAINDIVKMIQETNKAVDNISEAVIIIDSIAEQTNLLSLNASIEAARAGEAGKGFAVVADEIRNLAEQSASAAKNIQEIMGVLSEDSAVTMENAGNVQSIIEKQNDVIGNTITLVNTMIHNIDESLVVTGQISESVDRSNQATKVFSDTINSLSAISQENAASTEETRASMLELADTVRRLSEKATGLNTISKTLEEEMSFFS